MAQTTPQVVLDPSICHGKPVLAGTRVPVAIVTGSLAGGMSIDQVKEEYELTDDQVRAALRYVTELVERERHFPLAG